MRPPYGLGIIGTEVLKHFLPFFLSYIASGNQKPKYIRQYNIASKQIHIRYKYFVSVVYVFML